MTNCVFEEVRRHLGYEPTFHDARIVRVRYMPDNRDLELMIYYSDRPDGLPPSDPDGLTHLIITLTFQRVVVLDVDFTSNWIDEAKLIPLEDIWRFEWDDQEFGTRNAVASLDRPKCKVILAERRFEFEGRALANVNFILSTDHRSGSEG